MVDRLSSQTDLKVIRDKICFEQEAMWILQNVLKKNKAQLIMDFHEQVDEKQKAKIDKIVKKRLSGVPLQYILQSAEFGSMDLFVDKRVLIPRHETESWCYWALDVINEYCEAGNESPKRILDLCTGSGAIALYFASQFKTCKVFGSDISTKALQVAKRNRKKYELENVRFFQSDLFDKCSSVSKFDIIFTNPPYISPELYNSLDPQVRDFEPKNALIADNDGLEFYQKIFEQASGFLTNKNGFGWIFVEYDQYTASKVDALAKKNGFKQEIKFTDLFGKPRAGLYLLK